MKFSKFNKKVFVSALVIFSSLSIGLAGCSHRGVMHHESALQKNVQNEHHADSMANMYMNKYNHSKISSDPNYGNTHPKAARKASHDEQLGESWKNKAINYQETAEKEQNSSNSKKIKAIRHKNGKK